MSVPTEIDVKKVIETSLDVSVHLGTARVMVATHLADKSLSTDILNEVTLWLAAHFVALTEERGGMRRSKLGDADESYNTPANTLTGLSGTRYGQQAIFLDSSGTLAAMSANQGVRARFQVL